MLFIAALGNCNCLWVLLLLTLFTNQATATTKKKPLLTEKCLPDGDGSRGNCETENAQCASVEGDQPRCQCASGFSPSRLPASKCYPDAKDLKDECVIDRQCYQLIGVLDSEEKAKAKCVNKRCTCRAKDGYQIIEIDYGGGQFVCGQAKQLKEPCFYNEECELVDTNHFCMRKSEGNDNGGVGLLPLQQGECAAKSPPLPRSIPIAYKLVPFFMLAVIFIVSGVCGSYVGRRQWNQ